VDLAELQAALTSTGLKTELQKITEAREYRETAAALSSANKPVGEGFAPASRKKSISTGSIRGVCLIAEHSRAQRRIGGACCSRDEIPGGEFDGRLTTAPQLMLGVGRTERSL
jgi:hypothetical protein